MNQSIMPVEIHKVFKESGSRMSVTDSLAVEEPLEIRLEYGSPDARVKKTISITMRTPGNDFELALGFLFTEGVIQSPGSLEYVEHCGPILQNARSRNIVRVGLKEGVEFDLLKLERHFYTSSSCGVCGKTSIEALKQQSTYSTELTSEKKPAIHDRVVHGLPEKLRAKQAVFDSTGGLHASAIFSLDGDLLLLREDVGRHNALDKVIGWAYTEKQLPLRSVILLVSGRASFELVQKASMAGIRIFVAVGAPSSLAVELAREVNMTLIGFARENRFNIYHGAERINLARTII